MSKKWSTRKKLRELIESNEADPSNYYGVFKYSKNTFLEPNDLIYPEAFTLMTNIIIIEDLWDFLTNDINISPNELIDLKIRQHELLCRLEREFNIVDMHGMDAICYL